MTSNHRSDGTRRAPRWLSLQHAAERYGVSVDTLRRRIAAGHLPARRFGPRLIRVLDDDLEALFRPIPTIGTLRIHRDAG